MLRRTGWPGTIRIAQDTVMEFVGVDLIVNVDCI